MLDGRRYDAFGAGDHRKQFSVETMEGAEVLVPVGGHVEEEVLLRNEYHAAENEILKSELENRPRVDSDVEKLVVSLAESNPSRGAMIGSRERSPISVMKSAIKRPAIF